ncbi:efflux RND transporter permease subunit [Mesorhizobium sp. VK25A]|uniref:Efflux RND transporter permease subunit n=1 Tax=Mesorhizobium vachelliae TaxID=3072309 RepID=A0ABU5ABG3_9HYPH|nr:MULTISPECIES: efflux RND transporter permease subunit [unclassified Mesorhizobium]MDX8535049.1 efflux RND transporter permease subunit [Mesorhizobium sp. VK25D]MDX8547693.1 efflux RND transporter permease subunit [Mesorhizobium sp. VK25A]
MAATGVSAPFIRYPIATSLLMVGVLFVGVVAYFNLPVAPMPRVDFPTIQVSTNLPGADPITMASSVTQPLETQFAQIPGIAEMTSSSLSGSSQITLQFDLSVDIASAAGLVQSAINAAGGQLPKNLPNPPTYREVNPTDSPIMVIGVTSTDLPLTTVSDDTYTKLAQVISHVKGVAQVLVGGQQTPSIRVQLDPAKLAARGLSLEALRTSLSNNTVDLPKGNIEGDVRSFTIFANDQMTAASDWNNAIIAYRNGAPVRVKDIGQAVLAAQDYTQAAWADTTRGVVLIIFKEPGANIIDTVDKIKAELPMLTASLPASLKVQVLSDRTQTIRASVADVQFTLMLTIGLVVMVIFLFLRNVWATAIPAFTVPLALFGACGLMWFAGYSIDNLSLMALTISVGFVVDDAIVMLENIVRHIERGEKPMDAAMIGSREIGFTIISISISLVAVLIPLLLMSGIIGRLFKEFAMALAMTILVSAFVSLTLTPMLASRFIKPAAEAHHGRLYQWSERFFEAILNAYERGLDRALRHRFITLLAFLACVALTGYFFMIVPSGFFPQQDTGMLYGQALAGQDVSAPQMQSYMRQFAEIVIKDPAVAHFAAATGGGGNTQNTGRMFIQLKPRNERDASADQVIRRLQPKLAVVQGARLVMQASQDVRVGGKLSASQYQYVLESADVDALDQWAPKLLSALQRLPELAAVTTDQMSSGTTLTLQVDRDQAARYGLTANDVDNTLNDAFGQRQIAQYFTQLSTYNVIIEVLPSLRGDLKALGQIYMTTPSGSQVPLSAIAKWTTAPVQPLIINHEGQFPSVTISFNLPPNIALGQATAAIDKAAAQMRLPATIQTMYTGTAQAFNESLSSVPLLILGALVVVYLILGILYESYIHPLTILSTLPSAGLGALGTLLVFHMEFNLVGLIGVILLIGIVKKNGIMMVDFAIAAERDQHLSSLESIRQACLLRFRPIMMTTMVSMLGALPLMLENGTGAEIRQPLGYTMFGGLLVSQALTLFTTPVIYLYLDGLSHWLSSFVKREESQDEPELPLDEVSLARRKLAAE